MINNFEGDKFVLQEQGHRRTGTRFCLVEHDVALLGDVEFDWPQLNTLGMVASIRQEGEHPAETMQVKHYISSAKLSAKELLEGTRAH